MFWSYRVLSSSGGTRSEKISVVFSDLTSCLSPGTIVVIINQQPAPSAPSESSPFSISLFIFQINTIIYNDVRTFIIYFILSSDEIGQTCA